MSGRGTGSVSQAGGDRPRRAVAHRRRAGGGSFAAGVRAVELRRPGRQPVVSLAARHGVRVPRFEGLAAVPRDRDRVTADTRDRGCARDRGGGRVVPVRPSRGADDGLVRAGPERNVWYLGEATAELDRSGHVTSREGSWLAGRDAARAGIYMPATRTSGARGRRSSTPATQRTASGSSISMRSSGRRSSHPATRC